MEQKVDKMSGDENLPGLEILLDDFRNIIDKNGRVEFDEYGAQKEPAAIKTKVNQVRKLYDRIMSHTDLSIEDREDIGIRMEKAEDYLRGLEESGR
ncbi:hypothetical protein A2773_01350 [Candidatus Gottesmanbacteria bacterium RIFCSPHIGHO2_01_FULL_39_10]|uniref:Uncharacterized protein n=1 Tax=Candidatus Gottesmanbacteria bacterium RIFCSPHIGHO2_01_FULL_39_10 TaxID=1798375 RepID=A0A1F5ZSL5_9BACT|nr:MAG: hypothetical protein A2773_01350 [Candidatus Gottesmanbacteria bacterium RIFCSPHIGHO2_01_FULL_39_10]